MAKKFYEAVDTWLIERATSPQAGDLFTHGNSLAKVLVENVLDNSVFIQHHGLVIHSEKWTLGKFKTWAKMMIEKGGLMTTRVEIVRDQIINNA